MIPKQTLYDSDFKPVKFEKMVKQKYDYQKGSIAFNGDYGVKIKNETVK